MPHAARYARRVEYGINVFAADDALDEKVVARSSAMSAAVEALQRLAKEDRRVFVFGESGVGVGWLCRCIHRATQRRSGPLVEVAVQAIVPSEHERTLSHDWPGNVGQLATALAVRGHALHHNDPWDGFAFLRIVGRPNGDGGDVLP
jgi:transcriptional regulator with PAS, ATPase and Fis domain